MRRLVLSLAALLAIAVCVYFSNRHGLIHVNAATWSMPQPTKEWHDRHNAKVAEARRRAGQVDLLFVGDSITQDYELSRPGLPLLDFRPIWNQFFAPHRAMNLGFGSDRTYNVLWRLRHGEVDGLAPRDIVLLIGTNNMSPGRIEPRGEDADEIANGILAIVDELHERMTAARILVLGILPSGISAARTAETNAVNTLVRSRLAGRAYARWLDVSGIFLDGTRLREDLYIDPQLYGARALHPSPVGQRRMAEAVAHALYP